MVNKNLLLIIREMLIKTTKDAITHLLECLKLKRTMTSFVGKDMEQLEISHTTNRPVKWEND